MLKNYCESTWLLVDIHLVLSDCWNFLNISSLCTFRGISLEGTLSRNLSLILIACDSKIILCFVSLNYKWFNSLNGIPHFPFRVVWNIVIVILYSHLMLCLCFLSLISLCMVAFYIIFPTILVIKKKNLNFVAFKFKVLESPSLIIWWLRCLYFPVFQLLQILEGLLKLPENRECADCKAKYVVGRIQKRWSI